MNYSQVEDINRFDISSAGTFNDLNVLWIGGFTQSNKDVLDFLAHKHTFFEIHFILDGAFCYCFDNVDINLSAGNYLIIPPGCIHSISSSTSAFSKLTVSFEVTEGTNFASAVIAKTNKAHSIPSDVSNTLDIVIRRALSHTEYLDVIVKNRIYEMIALIADSYSPKSYANTEKITDMRIEKAKKYIDDNPQIFFICDEIAYYCRLSVKQLGRLFKEYEDCSLLEYIHKSKIAQIKHMIGESELTFEEISNRLGFSSVNYFGKFFTRCTGITPGEYRKLVARPKNTKN